ncbi:MAG: ferritin family protein [Chloroflexi bacterium]|nr:ferritin family protein [Chloroflexota bacterium]
MAKDSALKALSQALKLERDGRAFYLKAADEALDAKGVAMFNSLADDERQHAEMIERQLHALEGDGRYVVLPDLKAPRIDLAARLFPPERARIAAKVGADPNELDALHVALENEVKSYDLYREAAGESSDAAAKAMYEWLAAAELSHFNLLMSNYQSLAEGSGWV